MQVGPPSRQSRAAANSEVPARTRHWSRRCLVRSRKAPGDPLYLSRSSRRHEHRCCWRGQPLWFCGGRGRGERFGDKGFVRIAMKRAQAPLQEITTAPRQVPEASDRADCLSKAPEQQPTFCALLPARREAGIAVVNRRLPSRLPLSPRCGLSAQSAPHRSVSQMLAVSPEQVSVLGRVAVLVRR
jgi:hypothetical protein